MSMETKGDTSFGALRGGIFADEPGLGKTVTAIALISATAGSIPKSQQTIFWNEEGNYEIFLFNSRLKQ